MTRAQKLLKRIDATPVYGKSGSIPCPSTGELLSIIRQLAVIVDDLETLERKRPAVRRLEEP